MTETFVASNGVHVRPNKTVNGKTSVESSGAGHCLGGDMVQALREFFLHEAGIWVDPETGAHVYRRAYSDDRDGRCVLVVTPDDSIRVWEKLSAVGEGPSAIAARYLAAHPVPKPWHDAKVGEVWVLTTDQEGEGHAWMVDPDFGTAGRFVYVGGLSNIPLDHPGISAGRRIWPEVVSDA